jgi:hypothetical protein
LFITGAYRAAKEQQSKSSASVYLYQLSSEVKGVQFFPVDISTPGVIPCLCLPTIVLLQSIDLRENEAKSFKKYPLSHMSYVQKKQKTKQTPHPKKKGE